MRIIHRQQFLAMPPGTVYQKCDLDELTSLELEIKGAPIPPNDWFFAALTGLTAIRKEAGVSRFDDQLEAMQEYGKEYPYKASESRDGCYDASQLFLIYDTEDVRKLIDQLREALAVKEPPNVQT